MAPGEQYMPMRRPFPSRSSLADAHLSHSVVFHAATPHAPSHAMTSSPTASGTAAAAESGSSAGQASIPGSGAQDDPSLSSETPSRRLAFVGVDAHIYLSAPSSAPVQLTWTPRELTYGAWSIPQPPDQRRHLWPTWSPSGQRIACIRMIQREGDERTGVVVFDADVLSMAWELWSGSTSVPIYLSWVKDSTRMTIVLQQSEALSLHLANVDSPGETIPVLSGVPLFHNLSPNGKSLVAHLGGRFNGEPGRRLYRIDLYAPDRRLTLSEAPGKFGTPAWSPDGRHLAYTTIEDDYQAVTLIENGRGPYIRLGSFQGIGILSWQPDSQAVLAMTSGTGENGIYDQLWRFPLDSSRPELLVDEHLMGCYVLPNGRLLYFHPEPQSQALSVKVLEPGRNVRTLCTFYPSQPQLFFHQFFHQYQHSHRLLSADQSALVFSGYRRPEEFEDDAAMPQIYVLELNEERAPVAVAPGAIAFWSPV